MTIFVDLIFEFLWVILMVRIILSFIQHDPYHPVIRVVYDISEPILAPFRRLMPDVGGIDFSPIVAFLALELVRRLVLGLLSAF